jgi:hypothetical protein
MRMLTGWCIVVTCILIKAVAAWSIAHGRWETSRMERCVNGTKVEYRTVPEGLYYVNIEGKTIWMVK